MASSRTGIKRWDADEDEALRRLYPRAARQGLLTALPGRSWLSIRARAFHLDLVRPTTWSSEDVRALRNYYPSSPWTTILRHLPLHSREAITAKASTLGLKRPHGPKVKRHRLGPVAVLRQERLRQRKTQSDVAKRTGVHLNDLCRWEQGRGAPRLPNLIAWAQALDCRIEIIAS
jgi:hypothetical protein